jgi:predicted CXXCH cytochrome family protein
MDRPPPSLEGYGDVGLACYACHDGTTIVSGEVDASQGAFHPAAHPLAGEGFGGRGERGGEGKVGESCAACHRVHDNTLRPFLAQPLLELCPACHPGRENMGVGRTNVSGGHPVHETLLDDKGNRSPINAAALFRIPWPSLYPASGGRYLKGIHWRRGGHLSGGGEGLLECFTCHTVHGDEADPPRGGLLATEPVRKRADEFCESCHQGKRGDGQAAPPRPNPGGTTTARTYHPCDDDRSGEKTQRTPIRPGVAWPRGEGKPGPLLCTTCHSPHGGMPGSPALRQPVLAKTFCEECHLPQLFPAHHPVGLPPDGAPPCEPPPEKGTIGEVEPRTLYCSSCHVAHNAGFGRKEEEHVPILKEGLAGDGLCLLCHRRDNVNCRSEEEGTASHFLGDPTLPDSYEDPAPPLRTLPWAETNLSSRYGGEEGKVLICLSCHSFRVPSGPGTALAPLENHLVARSGNDEEWKENPAVYLCAGCHGTNPSTMGEGHTHPLMSAKAAALGKAATPPVTYTATGRVNCDSCHRTHGAPPQTGYYILEVGISANTDPRAIRPEVNFTGLCHSCHTADKY